MNDYLITRRQLLKAGLAASVVTLVPSIGLSVIIPESDLSPIGLGADKKKPYNFEKTGELQSDAVKLLEEFSSWAIAAWGFEGMDNYLATLPGVLKIKTDRQPSYLEEYKNAANLVKSSRDRLGNSNDAFLYLMFAGRDNENLMNTRLGRAQHFVFDELIRHQVANGGFRRFGFVNYKGFMSVSFTDSSSYRRSAT